MSEQITPQQEPAKGTEGRGTSIEKFKTAEERDKAYLEAEKKLHDETERAAKLEARYEELVATTAQPAAPAQPAPREEFTDVYKSRDEQEALTRFYRNPVQTLREVEERAVRAAVQYTTVVMQNQSIVESFKRDNPDLAKHEKVVAMFVQQESQALPPAERLERAAKKSREYLLEIARSGSTAAAPNPASFVEAPSGTHTPLPAGTAAPELSPEQELAEYARERANLTNKKRL